jgi:hypothetical protein
MALGTRATSEAAKSALDWKKLRKQVIVIAFHAAFDTEAEPEPASIRLAARPLRIFTVARELLEISDDIVENVT